MTKERGRRPAGGPRGVAPPGQQRDAGFAIGACAVLAAYNNVAGLHPGHDRWYVRLNLGATGAALAAAALGGLTAADIGIGRGRWLPGRLGCGLAAGAGVGWLLIAVVPATRALLGDNRIGGLDGRAAAYQALIRIPLGTALWEETAFRGVLQAALRRVLPGTAAIAVTSGVFGAWHIRPTLQALRANGLGGDRRRALAGTCAGVAMTAAAGVLLSWLRARSGRLAAPVLLHAAVNSGGLIAAHAVAARSRRQDSRGDVRALTWSLRSCAQTPTEPNWQMGGPLAWRGTAGRGGTCHGEVCDLLHPFMRHLGEHDQQSG